MHYVYIRFIKTGKENCLSCFETTEEAVRSIANYYRIDAKLGKLGKCYYFMEDHKDNTERKDDEK